MTTPSLSDLRFLFYGGGSAAEYQFLLDADAAGLTAASLIAGEIDYAEITVGDLTATVGTNVDLAAVIDVPEQPGKWWLGLGGTIFNDAAGGVARLRILEGATERSYKEEGGVANKRNTEVKFRPMAAFAGATRSFKLNIQNITAGTAHAIVEGTAADPIWIGAFKRL